VIPKFQISLASDRNLFLRVRRSELIFPCPLPGASPLGELGVPTGRAQHRLPPVSAEVQYSITCSCVNLDLAFIAIQTVGEGRVWQMIAWPRFVNRAAVLDLTGKRSVGKPVAVLPSGLQLLREPCG
jgi:hypothetical protein